MSDSAIRARALDPSRSFIVQAPAGSGKTELLIQRIAGEVKSKEPVVIVLQPELKVRESTTAARPRAVVSN